MKSSFFPVSAAGFFYYIENPAQSYVSAAEFCSLSRNSAASCVKDWRTFGEGRGSVDIGYGSILSMGRPSFTAYPSRLERDTLSRSTSSKK